MALDPKKWTTKTQEAVAAAMQRATMVLASSHVLLASKPLYMPPTME